MALNENVGFKIPTKRYRKSSICVVRYTVVPHSGLPEWGGASGLYGYKRERNWPDLNPLLSD